MLQKSWFWNMLEIQPAWGRTSFRNAPKMEVLEHVPRAQDLNRSRIQGAFSATGELEGAFRPLELGRRGGVGEG